MCSSDLNETELVRELAQSSTDDISGKIGLSVPTRASIGFAADGHA